MLALQAQGQAADVQASAAEELSLDQLHFRYAITGNSPPLKPVRAFDEAVNAATLIPHMLEAFIATDRGFPKNRTNGDN
jgi:type IV secretion system protein VirB9